MAAVSGTLLDSGIGSLNATSATTNSVATHKNCLQLLAVYGFAASFPPTTNDPTITDTHGLVWVEAATKTYGAASNSRLNVFRALKSSATVGTRTIDFAGQQQTAIIWEWYEFANVLTTGANGANAVVQVPTPTSGNSGTASVTLASFADATNNAAYGAIGLEAANTITADATGGYALDQTTSGGLFALGAEWKAGQDTTVTGTFTSCQWGMIGLEIQHGTPPTGLWPYNRGGRSRRTRQLPH